MHGGFGLIVFYAVHMLMIVRLFIPLADDSVQFRMSAPKPWIYFSIWFTSYHARQSLPAAAPTLAIVQPVKNLLVPLAKF